MVRLSLVLGQESGVDMNWLYWLTRWKIFRPERTEWGESTELWSEVDWIWFEKKFGHRDQPESDEINRWL